MGLIGKKSGFLSKTCFVTWLMQPKPGSWCQKKKKDKSQLKIFKFSHFVIYYCFKWLLSYRIICCDTTINKIEFPCFSFFILVFKEIGRKVCWCCRATNAYVSQWSIQTWGSFNLYDVDASRSWCST